MFQFKGEPATWFQQNWMFISAAIVPVSFGVLMIVWRGASWSAKMRSPLFVGWLTVVFYCWHQVEEHGYDMRGWRYGFCPEFNYFPGSFLFPECGELAALGSAVGHRLCPVYPLIAVYINVPVVWIGFPITMALAHTLRGPYVFAGFGNWGLSVVNALGGHLIPWLVSGYNPGAFQSVFMAGFGIFVMAKAGKKYFVCCMICGGLFHLISFGIGVNLLILYGMPEEGVAVMCILTSSALPLLVAKLAAPKNSDWYDVSSDAGNEYVKFES